MRKTISAVAVVAFALAGCSTEAGEPTPVSSRAASAEPASSEFVDDFGHSGQQTVEYWEQVAEKLTYGQLKEIKHWWEGQGVITDEVVRSDAANVCAMSARGMTYQQIADSVEHQPNGDAFKEQLYQADVISVYWFEAYVAAQLREMCPEVIVR